MEPVVNANATLYASTIMKTILFFGFCHTCVLDKDRKFFGVCREALDLLQINPHVLSSGSHNPMLVERLNWYLNKGLWIMTNESNSNRIALEAILLLVYAWKLCPVPGTDILHCMVALWHKFSFPIDFSMGKHAELYSAPGTVDSDSKQLPTCLSCCQAVAELLVKEQLCWHCKLINSWHWDTCIYLIGDIMFACWSTHSDSKHGHVDKLMPPFMGPWRIVKLLPRASYNLKFASNPSWKDKKHASDVSLPPRTHTFAASRQCGQSL